LLAKKNLHETLRKSKVSKNQGKTSLQTLPRKPCEKHEQSKAKQTLMQLTCNNAFRVRVMKKEYVRKSLKNLNAPSKQILKHSPSLPNELLPFCKPCKRNPQT
tara:strand:- start:68 stop:376 length:309 start_codon:yes stop_codon:yes gene_type:complete